MANLHGMLDPNEKHADDPKITCVTKKNLYSRINCPKIRCPADGQYPIIADLSSEVATLYGMLEPG